MRKLILGAVAAALLGACAGGVVPGILLATEAPVTTLSPHIIAAVADPRRPEADRARDALRHPADILAFAQVQPGQVVADIGPGGGYYTRMFAVAVGPNGRAIGVLRRPPADAPAPTQRPAIYGVADEGGYGNLEAAQLDWQNLGVSETYDIIFISQIYHDFHLPRFNYDIAALNRSLYAALKPGGALVVIDHAAPDGSDLTVTDTLHRIEQATARREIEAAGFVLEAESQVLRNPADNRAERVFEADIRGRTDQFVMRFRKPS